MHMIKNGAFRLFLISLHIPILRRITLASYIYWGDKQAKRTGRRTVFRDLARTVFVVYEPRFDRIIKELESRDVCVIILSRSIFDFLFRKHLSKYILENQRTFSEYALSMYERYKDERKAYLRDCTYIASLLRKQYSQSLIVMPKYNDDYTLELVQSFYDSHWRTVVYDREGTVTKRRLETVAPIVSRLAPLCHYVVIYNEQHKTFFESVFKNIETNKPEIIIMGNPASDDWFNDDKLKDKMSSKLDTNGRNILFFAFGEFSYVYDAEYLKDKDEVWRDLLSDIHQALMDHLRENSNDTLIYKRGPKGNRDYWAGSDKLLALSNANLVSSRANSNMLIAGSDMIIAFQTTALIDAMHTDKPIIYCAWGSRYDELKNDLIDFEEYASSGAIIHADSMEKLRSILAMNTKDIEVNLKERKRIREYFTSNPDGQVSSRFAEWLMGL